MKYHSMVTMRSATNSVLRNLFADLGSVTTFAVAVFLFLQGSYSIGTVYLIWSITSRVYWQMSSLSQVMRIIPQEYADAEKLFNLVDTEPSFNEGGRKIDSLEGDIVFSNLSFTYPKGDSPVLKNVSLSIPQGKRVAFVGGSGSGKTTLVKLLLRVYDYKEGSIKFGRDELRELDGGSIRERVGYVEQHVDLLDDTLKTNILIAVDKKHQKEAADELEEIAKKARITEFYHRLGEKKFDTVVGERGIKLSGGERQRVGIARAIIKNPDILIFDEATSSLDTENEKYVMEAIKEASADKTTIIIAHRLSTVKDADKIIVMDKGQVVGEGTHDELMQNSSYYRNLVEHQVLV
jgi:ABC-type multidrug transport system fused ATPase/permease subunit